MRDFREDRRRQIAGSLAESMALERFRIIGIESLMIAAQLRWAGRVVRIDERRIPKAIFYAVISGTEREAEVGSARDARTKTRASDNAAWELLTHDRNAWRTTWNCGTRFETERVELWVRPGKRGGEERTEPCDVRVHGQ